MQQLNKTPAGLARTEADGYQGAEDRPLGGYLVMMALFAALVAGSAGLARAGGRRLPAGLGAYDVLLLTMGTHKLSRTLSKDAVTSPLRAPFTRYSGNGAPGEVMEEVRSANGVQHAIGELITCPFCLDVWIATGFALGLVFAPQFTRLVAGIFTVLTGADFLHLAYAKAQQAAT